MEVCACTEEVEVLVFGSVIVDFVAYAERLPKAGETLHGHKFMTGYGGKGANQCVAAARQGAKTAMIAKLGDDSWGSNYLQQLRKENVNVDFVEQCQGEILVCQFETPLNATLDALNAFEGISILNAAPALVATPPELIKAATIFCVNETEAALTTGCEAISKLEHAKVGLHKLLEMGAKNVIITLGALGAVYATSADPHKFIHVPVGKVPKVVDTTGAGDAFIGALAYNMARFSSLPWHQLIGAANQVAAYSVQHPGTQASFPTGQVNKGVEYAWKEF
ncbi:ribokinase isoform X4 [Eurosta solidaginis]|uniref:ribokinase isoform X4 n=1 Tax=Eurosta solidaginis TaxID=178769 RepID=UPI00353166F7